jgi:hypothetical protein
MRMESGGRGDVGGRAPLVSPEVHEAYLRYRDRGPKRSLKWLAEVLGKSLSLLKRWSALYGWREKVAAWDRQQLEREHELARLAADGSRERRAANAAQLERVAMAALRSLMVKDPETGEVRFDKRLAPGEIAALLRVACRLWPTDPAPASEREAGTPETEELGRLSRRDVDSLLSMLDREEEGSTDTPSDEEDTDAG